MSSLVTEKDQLERINQFITAVNKLEREVDAKNENIKSLRDDAIGLEQSPILFRTKYLLGAVLAIGTIATIIALFAKIEDFREAFYSAIQNKNGGFATTAAVVLAVSPFGFCYATWRLGKRFKYLCQTTSENLFQQLGDQRNFSGPNADFQTLNNCLNTMNYFSCSFDLGNRMEKSVKNFGNSQLKIISHKMNLYSTFTNEI